MSVESEIFDLICLARKIDSLPKDDSNLIQLLGLLLHAKKAIIEGSKSGMLSEQSYTKLNSEVASFFKPPVIIESPKDVLTPRRDLSTHSSVVKQRKRQEIETDKIEEDMLRLTSDMREAAVGVQSTLQRDRAVLEMTSRLQDENMSQTKFQVSSAVDARKSRRLSLWMTIFMVLSSVVIFLSLVPIILVT